MISPPKKPWKPFTTLRILQAREKFLEEIRAFFQARQVLHVETPLLSGAATADEHLIPFMATAYSNEGTFTQASPYFLITSPEYFMKRLLCADIGAIYQITKCFRAGEKGRFHNPEFSMLEWYQPGYKLEQLMQETKDLVDHVLKRTTDSVTEDYVRLFNRFIGIDPITATIEEVSAKAKELLREKFSPMTLQGLNKSDSIQLLFSELIEPNFQAERTTFVTGFPIEQALLSAPDPKDPSRALRFELYHQGMELANGFFELQSREILRERFAAENQKLVAKGEPERPLDEHLIAAQEHGLPACSGVALGLDRLFMIQQGLKTIQEALPFTYENC